MSEIKRYECDMFGPYEVADGRFVLYEEHAKIVAELKAEIHKARSEGACEGQHTGFNIGYEDGYNKGLDDGEASAHNFFTRYK